MDNPVLTHPRENDSVAAHLAETMARQRAELAAIIGRHCRADGPCETPIPGLALFRGSNTATPTCTVVPSVFAIMAQGAKRLQVGDDVYEYDARHYMISSVDLPMSSRITCASAAEPYLGFALMLDSRTLAELTASLPPDRGTLPVDRGIAIGELSADIQNAALRLARLLDAPQDIPVLAPIITKELLYRLLTGPLGARLRQAVIAGSHSQQIARAIDWLRSNLDQSASIDQLAELANMSRSSLHHHFKALTAMTPVQYQKQLRLQEARRLMLAEDHDAATAAHRVGYESASQFSREYRRQFGRPPASDVAELRRNGG
ncbi:AraC family transcriptional regulator [Azospira restricta]|uniref:AraC family transcriptional regulator n=1 Tax=Azospira restricta TaxID=404405 RepID=A0A974PXL3_9RHOO|nr:AraC family transcriptional regulator [Azospira restricta]